MPPSSMNDLFAFLSQLMTEHASLFEVMGAKHVSRLCGDPHRLVRAKSALFVRWRRSRSLIHFDQFASMLMTIAFGFGMITYYSRPIPGFGVSFYHLIIDQGLALAKPTQPFARAGGLGPVDGPYWGMETPGLTLALNILEVIRYARHRPVPCGGQAAVFAVIAFGYIASANRGPVGTDLHSIFHCSSHGMGLLGWLKSLIQYAFLPRCCQRVSLRVWGIFSFISSTPTLHPTSGATI